VGASTAPNRRPGDPWTTRKRPTGQIRAVMVRSIKPREGVFESCASPRGSRTEKSREPAVACIREERLTELGLWSAGGRAGIRTVSGPGIVAEALEALSRADL